MLPINLISVLLLADKVITSPVSRINLPWIRLAESLEDTGKSFTISVVTAIPAVVLWWEKETVWVSFPILDACAKRTTPV